MTILKQIKEKTGVNIADLCVLAQQNDPFNSGTKGDIDKARWFTEIYERFGFKGKVHLRRIHYRIVSEVGTKKHNGQEYFNTENDWLYLNETSRHARYLGMVSPEAFVDKRNPGKHFFIEYESVSPNWRVDEYDLEWPIQAMNDFEISRPCPDITGYDYSGSDEKYHVEVWIEKSTMDDVLAPMCRSMHVNYITSVGFQSITNVIEMLNRLSEMNKECRIFYISDFDPAGDSMPVSVARQLEFWIMKMFPDRKVMLNPLVLTWEQVQKYRLPRTPIKDKDKRKGIFEDKHGQGAVELDALESLFPGELAKIVREALSPYRDTDHIHDLDEAKEEAVALVEDAIDAVWEDHEDEIESIESNVNSIFTEFRDRVAPYQTRLENLQHAIRNDLAMREVELPDRPEVAVDPDEEPDEWLFDSSRDYLTQLGFYKQQQNGSTTPQSLN